MPEQLSLEEAFGSLNDVQQAQATGGRFRALLIKAGWGSSGYYSEEVLRRDGPKAWPAGTQNYLDHPTVTESAERPERSVRELASVTTTDPVWDAQLGGLVAEVEVFPQWRGLLNEEFATQVGLSIRALGAAEYGTADGRDGPLITEISEGISVDWVTRAGAGGRVLELIESARAQIAEAAVSDKPWSDFSAADYDAAQWRRACLIDTGEGAEDSKDRYKLPVREPDGTLNRNAVHAAAGGHGVSAVKGVPAEKKMAAAKQLVGLYRNQLKEDPPDGLLKAAGEKQAEAVLVEARNVGQWFEAQIHSAFTGIADNMYGNGRLTREERIGLSAAIGDGLDAFTRRVEADQPQLYKRDLWASPDDGEEMSEGTRRLLREGHGMTARDLEAALCRVVKETYGGREIYTWVRDNTDGWVVWSLESRTDSALYQQTYTVDEATKVVTLTGEPVEVAVSTTYTPVKSTPQPASEADKNAPGSPPAEEKKEGAMPEITEEQARQLEEAAATTAALAEANTRLEETTGRVTDLERRLAESDARNQRLETDRQARAAVAEALKTSGLPALAHARVTESVCRSLPTVEGGALDDAKLTEAITAAIDAEKAYVAALAEASGAGLPRGLGESAGTEVSEADIDKELAAAFQGLGLDEKAAATAAQGRH